MDSQFLLSRFTPDRGNLLDYESHVRRLRKISKVDVKKKVVKDTETTLKYFRFKNSGAKPNVVEEMKVSRENSLLREKIIKINKKTDNDAYNFLFSGLGSWEILDKCLDFFTYQKKKSNINTKEQVKMSLEILLIKFFKQVYDPDPWDDKEIYYVELKSNDLPIFSSEKGTFDKLLKLKINACFQITKEKNSRKVLISIHKIKNEKSIFCGSGELILDNFFALQEVNTLVVDFFTAKPTRYAHLAKPPEWEKSGCAKLSVLLEVEKQENELSRVNNSRLNKVRDAPKEKIKSNESKENAEEAEEVVKND